MKKYIALFLILSACSTPPKSPFPKLTPENFRGRIKINPYGKIKLFTQDKTSKPLYNSKLEVSLDYKYSRKFREQISFSKVTEGFKASFSATEESSFNDNLKKYLTIAAAEIGKKLGYKYFVQYHEQEFVGTSNLGTTVNSYGELIGNDYYQTSYINNHYRTANSTTLYFLFLNDEKILRKGVLIKKNGQLQPFWSLYKNWNNFALFKSEYQWRMIETGYVLHKPGLLN